MRNNSFKTEVITAELIQKWRQRARWIVSENFLKYRERFAKRIQFSIYHLSNILVLIRDRDEEIVKKISPCERNGIVPTVFNIGKKEDFSMCGLQ